MRNRREAVIDIRAFNRSLIISNKPLSVNVKDNQEACNEINWVPGSFHINRMTRDKTNRTGRRYQLNKFLRGSSECQYNASIKIYKAASRTMLWAAVNARTMTMSNISFVQGLILESTERPFSL